MNKSALKINNQQSTINNQQFLPRLNGFTAWITRIAVVGMRAASLWFFCIKALKTHSIREILSLFLMSMEKAGFCAFVAIFFVFASRRVFIYTELRKGSSLCTLRHSGGFFFVPFVTLWWVFYHRDTKFQKVFNTETLVYHSRISACIPRKFAVRTVFAAVGMRGESLWFLG